MVCVHGVINTEAVENLLCHRTQSKPSSATNKPAYEFRRSMFTSVKYACTCTYMCCFGFDDWTEGWMLLLEQLLFPGISLIFSRGTLLNHVY